MRRSRALRPPATIAVCAAAGAIAAATSSADEAARAHPLAQDAVAPGAAQGPLGDWQPLVQRAGAELRFERAGRARARVLRLSDRPGRAGYVAVSRRLRPSASVSARADLNLVAQRLRRSKVRPLIAVGGRDGTSYQAGVLRRRSGRMVWAVWTKTPAGRSIGLSAGGVARTRAWHDVRLDTGWAGRRARATLLVDGRMAARTRPRDLATAAGERVILGLGRVSAQKETGTLLVRSARISSAPPGAGAGGAPAPGFPGAPSPAAPSTPGDFGLLPPGASLPSDRDCAARILRSSWEPRPENYAANHLTPGRTALPDNPDFDARWNSTLKPRITGAFVGTTDEIIQWAACKWGLGVDMLRAQAVEESLWRQGAAGDPEARASGNCTPDDQGDPCPTSFGVLQNKWYFNRGAYPMLRTMTSFHMDWSAAKLRGCYEGGKGYPRGDIWACVGEWFSGAWKDAGALGYVSRVQGQLDKRPWSGWEDRGASVPYRTELVE